MRFTFCLLSVRSPPRCELYKQAKASQKFPAALHGCAYCGILASLPTDRSVGFWKVLERILLPYAKIQCQKAFYRSGGGHSGSGAGRGQPGAHPDGSAAHDEPALPAGDDHLSRCQPGAGGKRRDPAAGKQPVYAERRKKCNQPKQRELQPDFFGIPGRYRHGQRHGQGQHCHQPAGRRPA